MRRSRRCARAAPSTVTALSGGESVEEAYALARLLRQGLGANEAVLPEEVPDGFDAYRAPLSALREAKTIAVVCDEPVVERAPVVDLWLRSARRKGATITYGVPDGDVDALVTDHRRPASRRDQRLLPAAHAERPRRHRCLERGGRRRARRREAPAARHLGRRGGNGSRRPCHRSRRRVRPRDRDVRGQLPRHRRPRPPRHELPRA